jgi:hypothetical protein
MQIKRITVQTKVGIILRNEHSQIKPAATVIISGRFVPQQKAA